MLSVVACVGGGRPYIGDERFKQLPAQTHLPLVWLLQYVYDFTTVDCRQIASLIGAGCIFDELHHGGNIFTFTSVLTNALHAPWWPMLPSNCARTFCEQPSVVAFFGRLMNTSDYLAWRKCKANVEIEHTQNTNVKQLHWSEFVSGNVFSICGAGSVEFCRNHASVLRNYTI